jgi:transposase-like protein
MDTSSAVADLQSHWHTLCDLDRARAVQAVHLAGVSLKDLAPELNCSATLLSHLLRALQASAKDRELARSGEISTRELVRRAGSSGTRSTLRRREAIAFELERAALLASEAITKWLDEEKVAGSDREQVIVQACLHLTSADKLDLGSLGATLPDLPVNEVIRLFRPALLQTDEEQTVARFARWLGLWTLHWISDDRVRARALELAGGEKIKTSRRLGPR